MTTREALHATIDQLPEGVLSAVGRALERLRDDPVQFARDMTPYDDEPESEYERRAVADARAQLAAGLGIAHNEVVRRLDALR